MATIRGNDNPIDAQEWGPLWVEIRLSVRRSGPPKLVCLENVSGHVGFRSVFAYPQATAELIVAQGGTAGLRGVDVYADKLFVDFDGRNSEAFNDWLVAQEYEFERLDSGNRSDHYEISMVPVCGAWVAPAYKKWLQDNAPGSDCSYAHPAGQFRLRGTFHVKNPGHRKRLVSTHAGRLVTLKPLKTSNVSLAHRFHADEGDAYHKFFAGLTQTISEGGRRPYVFRNALLGAEAGLTEAEVLDHMLFWNANFCVPCHEPRAVAEQVSNAFKYLLRKVGQA